jgi:polyisoprenoid-binding protein YceI
MCPKSKSIYTTEKDFLTAEIDFWIDVASIETGNPKRDEHLKSADFFDAQNHKQITFTASTIGESDNEGNHALWGELTIKGITQNIKLDVQFGGIVKDPWGNQKAGFTVTGVVNRTLFGLTWNAALETGGIMVSEDVTISCELELTNAGQENQEMVLEPASAKAGL